MLTADSQGHRFSINLFYIRLLCGISDWGTACGLLNVNIYF